MDNPKGPPNPPRCAHGRDAMYHGCNDCRAEYDAKHPCDKSECATLKTANEGLLGTVAMLREALENTVESAESHGDQQPDEIISGRNALTATEAIVKEWLRARDEEKDKALGLAEDERIEWVRRGERAEERVTELEATLAEKEKLWHDEVERRMKSERSAKIRLEALGVTILEKEREVEKWKGRESVVWKQRLEEQEKAQDAEAKVSELYKMVAGLREFVEVCAKSTNPENTLDRMKRARKALDDTAKTAKAHDARVRAETLEELVRENESIPLLIHDEALAYIEAKATEARTEAEGRK